METIDIKTDRIDSFVESYILNEWIYFDFFVDLNIFFELFIYETINPAFEMKAPKTLLDTLRYKRSQIKVITRLFLVGS